MKVPLILLIVIVLCTVHQPVSAEPLPQKVTISGNVVNKCAELLYEYGKLHFEELDEGYYHFIAEYPVNQPDALHCSQYYREIMNESISYLFQTLPEYQTLHATSREKFLVDLINHFTTDGISVAEEIQLTQAFKFVLEKDHHLIDTLWNAYEQVVKLPVLKQQLSYALQEAKHRAGQLMTLQELASQEALADIFNKIRADHQGKVLYIDCWATWCKPCIQEFPNSSRLHEQVKDKEIEFIYLCLGSNKAQWQTLVDKYGLQGSHFYLDGPQIAHLQNILNISGVPRYLIINKAQSLMKMQIDQVHPVYWKN